MRVLVIGGTGLISTAICSTLAARGDHVTIYNRGMTANRLPTAVAELRGDRTDYQEFESAFSNQTFDVVIDMVAFHKADSESAVRAFSGRTAQFIHCSTVSVYCGPSRRIPTREDEPFQPTSGYSRGKVECEHVLNEASEALRFPVTIMRPSLTYGPGGPLVRPFGPPDTFVHRLRTRRPLIVSGDGNTLCSPCHAVDVAAGFAAVVGRDNCIGQTFHVTGDEWLTWNDYLQQAADAVDGKFIPVYISTDTLRELAPHWSGNTHRFHRWPAVFDNSKIKAATEFTGQRILWRAGIKETIDWLERTDTCVNATNDLYEDQLIMAWNRGVTDLAGGIASQVPTPPRE